MKPKGPVISIEGVSKRFGRVAALEQVSLDLVENEFFALLGPSGCGKTTLLRMIAGFEAPDGGRILLDGEDLVPVQPNRRPINLMFQSYALFPHMSVQRNISYGLEMERLGKAEIQRRVDAIVTLTALQEVRNRKPDQLSGGQRQRVALARALVKRPRVLLLDEPLAALDKKLREQMQLELKRLQHDAGVSFLMVTHDQEEALVMANRIAVMNLGRVEQVGTPRELYEAPANRFVASFIGVMNMFEGRASGSGVEVQGIGMLAGRHPVGLAVGEAATIAVRPERVHLATDPPRGAENCIIGRIVDVAYHGQDVNVHLIVPGRRRLLARLPSSAAETLDLAPGARLVAHWERKHSRIFND